jgi:hypothetical protein
MGARIALCHIAGYCHGKTEHALGAPTLFQILENAQTRGQRMFLRLSNSPYCGMTILLLFRKSQFQNGTSP